MADEPPIGEYLKQLRLKRGWTQDDVAGMIEWDQAKVSKIERGVRAPSLDDLATMSRLFGAPITRLVRIRTRAA